MCKRLSNPIPRKRLQEYACNVNNLRGIMKETGDNRYKPAHNNSRNRKKETGSPIDLRANLEDYNIIDVSPT